MAQEGLHLLRAAIARGLAYTDIAPRLAFWHGAETMHAEAQQTGARLLLGAGLSPGISNIMARQLATALGSIDRIETAILLSLGDEYGPDSLKHVLAAIAQPYTILERGQRRTARPFSEGKWVRFAQPVGRRVAYLFPWSDVVYYPRTLGAQTALGRFALDPPWAGCLTSLLARAGARRWLLRRCFLHGNRRAIEPLARLYAGCDYFALTVTAEGTGRALAMRLAGRRQADVTAAGAAVLGRALAAGEVAAPGLWLPEQVILPEHFFRELEALGWRPVIEVVSPATWN